jgi:signal-transduction protein with cAMP-binding, CBS, and nucleotidyltransferase domain
MASSIYTPPVSCQNFANPALQDFFSLLRQKESERLFEYAAPKQIVWKGGVTKDVYFIYDGDVEVYDEAGVIFHLRKNDHFGM